jgi:electron transfer flavoprotein alpha subunit
MSLIIFAENTNGEITKAGLEAIGYGVDLAENLGMEAAVLTHGSLNGDGGSGKKGAKKVLVAEGLDIADTSATAATIAEQMNAHGATVAVFAHDQAGKNIAPRVAARLDGGMVSGVTSMPDTSAGFTVKKNVFSGKAIAEVSVKAEKKVLTLLPNSYKKAEVDATAEVSTISPAAADSRIVVKEFTPATTDGSVPLPEAELVVSAGRGLKGPENWGIVEELAETLGAATACSRPVSDIGWRPHHEHVGQTGIAIRPNLYIAAGISGAIQHLAGVNGSKTIVVINTDPEAPFFKAADYGVVGDAFEVVPTLIEKLKAFKAQNA